MAQRSNIDKKISVEEQDLETNSEYEISQEELIIPKGDDSMEKDSSSDFTQDEVLSFIRETALLKKENEGLKDELLRGKAEMENSKKRLSRYYENLYSEKNRQLLLDIVVLLDDFERAFEAENSSTADETKVVEYSVLEGMKMIKTQFLQTLENKWKVACFDSVNESFDPQKHEAVMSENNKEIESPVVVAEFSKGYMVGDKILRSAKVKVAMP